MTGAVIPLYTKENDVYTLIQKIGIHDIENLGRFFLPEYLFKLPADINQVSEDRRKKLLSITDYGFSQNLAKYLNISLDVVGSGRTSASMRTVSTK